MLWYHQYPMLCPEVATLLAVAVAVSLAVTAVFAFTRPLVRALGLCLLVTLSLMVHFNLFFVGILVSFGISLVLASLFGKRLPRLIAAVFGALIIGAYLDNLLHPGVKLATPSATASEDMDGPIIHILMDGFIAPDGLPGPDEASNLKEEIYSFFREFDFELHPKAYSHYGATLDSMTRALNFKNGDENLFIRAQALREPMTYPENAWFEILDRQGHQINVFQSESMDYCNVELSRQIRCNSFPMPFLRTINRDLRGTFGRVQVLTRILINQSTLMTKILRDNKLLGSWGVSVYDERLLPLLTDEIIDRPQDAFFAHVLVPHSPLIFSDECVIDYESEPWTRWPSTAGLVANSPDSRKKRYKKIVPQTQCAMKLLRGVFEQLQAAGMYDDATIIVHGDHGTSAYVYSPSRANMERSFKRDFLETYATLYAVKWPDGKFKVLDDVKSLNVLIAETAVRVTGQTAEELNIEVIEEDEPFIYLFGDEPLTKVYVNIFE
jgi:hypothetical protein